MEGWFASEMRFSSVKFRTVESSYLRAASGRTRMDMMGNVEEYEF